MIPQKMTECQLNSEQLADLKLSGISLNPGNYKSVDAEEAKQLTGHKLEGMVIFYHAPDKQPYRYNKNGNKWGSTFARIKPNWDRIDEKTKEAYRDSSGKLPKYLSPGKAGVRPYFSLFQDWSKIVRSTFNAVDITEGEKKADKACLEGFPTIGLGGVTCFQDKRKSENFEMGSSWDTDEPEEGETSSHFLEELSEIDWKYRKVGICFDSDIVSKYQVKSAMIKLANQLKNKGAFPFPIILPNELDGSKNGLDDFIVRHGVDAYQKIRETCLTVQNSSDSLLKKDKKTKHLYIEQLEPNSLLKGILCWSVLKEKWAYREEIGLYRWTGTHWSRATEEALEADIVRFMDAQGWVNSSTSILSYLVRIFKNRAAITKDLWNDPNKLCFKNGVLDITTNQFTVHNRQDYLTMCLGYDYNQLAQCPTWENFIQEAMGGSDSLIQLLRAWMKWILFPKPKDDVFEVQKTLDLSGRKGTGKGTFLDVLRKIVGTENCGHASTDTFKNPNGLAQMLDKKVAIDSDASGFLENVGCFNEVASNEPVLIKILFKDVVETRLGVVVVRAYNDFIKVPSSGSEGLDRRLCIVPFKNKPQTVDPMLTQKLTQELPGIFRWVWTMDIEEAKTRIHNSGDIKEIAEATEESFLDRCPVVEWLQDRFPDGVEMLATPFYEEYKLWADGGGVLSKHNLRKTLINLGILETSKVAEGIKYIISPMKAFNVVKYLGITHTQTEDQPVTEIPKEPTPLIWDDLLKQIDEEMARLGWDKERGRQHLLETYGKKSRQQLSDDQAVEFLEFLKSEKAIDQIPEAKTEKGKQLYIKFTYTPEQLFNGKSVTRRMATNKFEKGNEKGKWTQSWADQFIKAYQLGHKVAAYSGSDKVGYITLTEVPRLEKLNDMPTEDLAKEGFPDWTKEQFINEYFRGDGEQNVWVVRFKFYPLEG